MYAIMKMLTELTEFKVLDASREGEIETGRRCGCECFRISKWRRPTTDDDAPISETNEWKECF